MPNEVTSDSGKESIRDQNILDIQKILPHRPPFLYVDKVINIIKGESATGIKNVTMNEPFFVGHFPQEPVLPGVIIIEALAQTSCVMVGASLGNLIKDGQVVYFLSIENAKFRQKVGPGDVLELKVKKIHGRGGMWKMAGEAYVGDKLCAEATFTAMVAPPPKS